MLSKIFVFVFIYIHLLCSVRYTLLGIFKFVVEATDRDEGNNSLVQFSLVQAYPEFTLSYFRIVSASNATNITVICVIIIHIIDRELIGDVIFLTVLVRDRGYPSLSSAVNITINIEEVNDETPVLDPDSFVNFMIRENIPIFSTLTTYIANDPDKFPILTYSIEPSEIPFAISRDNGTLYVVPGLDYERTQNYTFLVVVEDKGSETGEQRDYLIVRVNILDANDNCPNFTNLPLPSALQVALPAYNTLHIFNLLLLCTYR